MPKRRRRVQFSEHVVSDSDDETHPIELRQAPHSIHRHTQYSVQPSGVSVRNSFHSIAPEVDNIPVVAPTDEAPGPDALVDLPTSNLPISEEPIKATGGMSGVEIEAFEHFLVHLDSTTARRRATQVSSMICTKLVVH